MVENQRLYRTVLAAAFVALAIAPGTSSAAPRKILPSFDQVESTVEGYFSQDAHQLPGEIISRSQVRAILDLLQRKGWKVPHQQEILDRVLDDSDPLVRELRTKDGRKFAHQVSHFPQGYDRLEPADSHADRQEHPVALGTHTRRLQAVRILDDGARGQRDEQDVDERFRRPRFQQANRSRVHHRWADPTVAHRAGKNRGTTFARSRPERST